MATTALVVLIKEDKVKLLKLQAEGSYEYLSDIIKSDSYELFEDVDQVEYRGIKEEDGVTNLEEYNPQSASFNKYKRYYNISEDMDDQLNELYDAVSDLNSDYVYIAELDRDGEVDNMMKKSNMSTRDIIDIVSGEVAASESKQFKVLGKSIETSSFKTISKILSKSIEANTDSEDYKEAYELVNAWSNSDLSKSGIEQDNIESYLSDEAKVTHGNDVSYNNFHDYKTRLLSQALINVIDSNDFEKLNNMQVALRKITNPLD